MAEADGEKPLCGTARAGLPTLARFQYGRQHQARRWGVPRTSPTCEHAPGREAAVDGACDSAHRSKHSVSTPAPIRTPTRSHGRTPARQARPHARTPRRASTAARPARKHGRTPASPARPHARYPRTPARHAGQARPHARRHAQHAPHAQHASHGRTAASPHAKMNLYLHRLQDHQ